MKNSIKFLVELRSFVVIELSQAKFMPVRDFTLGILLTVY